MVNINLYADEVAENKYIYKYNGDNDLQSKEEYNQAGLLISETHYSYSGVATLSSYTKDTYQYDNNNQKISDIEYSYNASGTLESEEKWLNDNKSGLIPVYEKLYTNGQLTSSLSYTDRTLDVNGNITGATIIDNLNNDSIYGHVVRNGNTFEFYKIDGNQEVLERQYVFTFDESGNVLTETGLILRNSSWVQKYQDVYTYGQNNIILSEEHYQINESDLEHPYYYKKNNTYDGNNLLASYTQEWHQAGGDGTANVVLNYDNGRLISEIRTVADQPDKQYYTDVKVSDGNYYLGTYANELIQGSDKISSAFNGNGGNDTIIGGSGNDNIDNSGGTAIMIGGAGDDTYVVNNLNDVIIEGADGGNDQVLQTVNNYTLDANVETLRIYNELGLTASGNDSDNTIIGSYGNDTIIGGKGNDVLYGSGGDAADAQADIPHSNDTYLFNQGDGFDTIKDGDGTDKIIFGNGILKSNTTFSLTGNDLLVNVNGSDTDKILIKDWNTAANNIEELCFSDGSKYINSQINASLYSHSSNFLYRIDPTTNTVMGKKEFNANGQLVEFSFNVDNVNTKYRRQYDQNGVWTGVTVTETTDQTITARDEYEVDATGRFIPVTHLWTNNSGIVQPEQHYQKVFTNNVLTQLDILNLDNNKIGEINTTDTGTGANRVITSNGFYLDGDTHVNPYTDTQTFYSDGQTVKDFIHYEPGDLGGTHKETYDTAGRHLLIEQIDNASGANFLDRTTFQYDANGNFTSIIQTYHDSSIHLDKTITSTFNYLEGGLISESRVIVTTENNGDPVTTNDKLIYSNVYSDNGVYNDTTPFNVISASSNGSNNISATGGSVIVVGGSQSDLISLNSSGNAVVMAGQGNDTIADYGTNTTYYYSLGDGSDIITDPDGTDVIKFTGVNPNNLTFDTIGDNHENLLITISDTDKITIQNWVTSLDNQIETFKFDNGSVWTAQTINNILNGGIRPNEGTSGNDVINGTANDDIINGFAGNDIINGLDGNDTIDGGVGSDTMVGGLGNDTYIVDNLGDVVLESSNSGNDKVITNLVNYTLSSNVENLDMTASVSVRATGNSLDNTITTEIGNNTIFGMAGNDIITTGTASDYFSGDDYIDGGAGADTMSGGLGSDTYIVDNLGDVVIEDINYGYDNNAYDKVISSVNDYTLADEVENLELSGTIGMKVTGNYLGNTITGTVGIDTLIGANGDDTYYVNSSSDVVVETNSASSGNDTVISTASYTLSANVENLALSGTVGLKGVGNELGNTIVATAGNNTLLGFAGNDVISGGTGNDIIDGGIGNDIISGEAGDDTIDGGAGIDTMIGGLGNDTYIVDELGDSVYETINAGIDKIKTNLINYTLASNVENLEMTGTLGVKATGNELSNTITVTSGNNTIFGLEGNDVITTGSGNDTIDGGVGIDTMTGGLGNDTYIVDNSADVIIETSSINSGIDKVMSSVSYTLSSNVENLELTGSAGIRGVGNELVNTIIASAGNNTLLGFAGNDVILGGTGDDLIDGGVGTDTMTGGLGNDTYIVDNLADVVIETNADGSGIDKVQTALASYTLGASIENLEMTGTTGVKGTGNELANIITGASGNDTIDGGSGADTMIGGLGNDTYIVDNLSDVVNEGLNAGIDKVQVNINDYTLAANVENLDIIGSAGIKGSGNELANTITATAGNNSIFSLAGNDFITGGSGNDLIDGGIGTDTMAGGLGNDTYIVDNLGDVVIESVNSGTDKVKTDLVNYTLATNVE
ncbi:MAG: calcium-binding protein, partial [bacterium]